MKSLHTLFTCLVGIFFLSSCGGSNQKAQSINNGLTLFETNCSSCHQKEGTGMATLFPPLKGSDYLKANYANLPCIIHNGLKGKIKVNGVEYDNVMAPLASLGAQEIADISNYVLSNFNQMDQTADSASVANALASCK